MRSFLIGTIIIRLNLAASMHIAPITRAQIPEAKQLIVTVWNDVHGDSDTVEDWEMGGYFDDLNDFESKFITFLVLLDHDVVVGSAGVKRLSADICELKRLWILKRYRNKGWGSQLLTHLESDARARGFTRMRLEVYSRTKQVQAVTFYRKFGFYEIAPYCDSGPNAIFMEKVIT